MLELFFTGIIIGILVSSPMGPIGMLCIQRTLLKGKLSGFISGLGADARTFDKQLEVFENSVAPEWIPMLADESLEQYAVRFFSQSLFYHLGK